MDCSTDIGRDGVAAWTDKLQKNREKNQAPVSWRTALQNDANFGNVNITAAYVANVVFSNTFTGIKIIYSTNHLGAAITNTIAITNGLIYSWSP